MKEAKAIKALLPLVKIYPWAIPVVIVLGILSSLSEGLGISLFIPLLQNWQQTSSQVSNNNFFASWLNSIFGNISDSQRLLIIAVCILGSVLLKNCLSYIGNALFSWFNSQIGHRLRCNVFKQLLSVSYSFLEVQESGKLMNTLATETWRTSQALSVLISMIINICTISIFTVFLLLLSWQLTGLVAICMILISLVIQFATRQVERLGKQAVKANSHLANQMWEGFGGMKVIRAFGRESYEQHRFERASEGVRASFFKLDLLSGIVNPLSEILSVVLLLCILTVSLVGSAANLPTILTFIFILYRLQPQAKQLDGARVSLVSLTSSVQDVMSLLDRTGKPYIHSGHIPFKGLKQKITLSSVDFSYAPTEKSALRDVSFVIAQGKTTALVGPSGAGKSTLIDLIFRLYDVTGGEIYVDDYSLEDLNLVDWRSRIAIVSQDVHVFSTTIRDNIAYGCLEATTSEIIAAAKLAHADEFIQKLPQGYDTQVGDRGVRLSGGQRQRLAFARAVIRDPEILILDEATNSLDSISENLIQEALKTLSQNRTVIMIAHRLSTIEAADHIVVIEQGKVVEQGNSEQLLQMNGLFAKLYRLQYSRNIEI